MVQQYFPPDNGTLSKNIPPLDEVDDGEKVSTCHALNFSVCISPSTVARNIFNITQYSASSISIGYTHTDKIENLDWEVDVTVLIEVTVQGGFLM